MAGTFASVSTAIARNSETGRNMPKTPTGKVLRDQPVGRCVRCLDDRPERRRRTARWRPFASEVRFRSAMAGRSDRGVALPKRSRKCHKSGRSIVHHTNGIDRSAGASRPRTRIASDFASGLTTDMAIFRRVGKGASAPWPTLQFNVSFSRSPSQSRTQGTSSSRAQSAGLLHR